ncbi:Nitrogen regulatory protein P-II [Planktothrix tepida]|uniref:Nitrogen regulatory protein P-II n=2 Tax=Planktothrix TaxID=54304 RepID=A0A1J1LS74_9CYAN|nr:MULTISPECIES: transcriptional regulator [Planktothrix]CAD5947539.1 Nitrogen regulatory protein P-II [Planktothrix pseudagardhii]CAD5963091.1 Nitrogen regulatory protein P-II [Planktothrix tepida]CUR34866.1 Nitrogen regulatory protein P-II [Planktothrix tepida PCC 9214]
MQAVKKVEIIISTLEIQEVLEVLDEAKVTGYTVIKNASGKGDRGLSNDDLGSVFSNAYIMTVCTNEKQLEQIVSNVTPLLKRVGGVCLINDATWIHH